MPRTDGAGRDRQAWGIARSLALIVTTTFAPALASAQTPPARDSSGTHRAPFRFSGYVQARWESGEAKNDSVRVAGTPLTLTPANNERFFVRRARLKLTCDPGPRSQAVIQVGAGAERDVKLLEAYVTLRDPWTTDQRHQLTIGQMMVPFGYELERSSSVRELPERSRAENNLFPGERDRGIKLVDQWTPSLETVVGIFNGGGINHPDFPNSDPTRGKDVVGRGRFSPGRVSGAVSWYRGRNTIALTGEDIQTDKSRLGLDAQIRYRLPRLGGGSFMGEYYGGHEVNPDSVTTLITSSDGARLLNPGARPSHLATDFTGWYVMWVHDAGERLELAMRYDAFDPNSGAEHDQFGRFGIGADWSYDNFTRIMLAYDVPRTERAIGGGRLSDPHDNLWTAQVQFKF